MHETFHSPVDEIVPIDEAVKIYRAALHPMRFPNGRVVAPRWPAPGNHAVREQI